MLRRIDASDAESYLRAAIRALGFVSPTAYMIDALREQIDRDGFAFVAADDMRRKLAELSDWARFATSWNNLQLDMYLPDGHRYRRRRHATMSALAGQVKVTREPHQPHYQSIDYNPLAGGIERWFEPI